MLNLSLVFCFLATVYGFSVIEAEFVDYRNGWDFRWSRALLGLLLALVAGWLLVMTIPPGRATLAPCPPSHSSPKPSSMRKGSTLDPTPTP